MAERNSRRGRSGGGAGRGAAQPPEHALGALGDPAAVHVQRRGDVGGRRAVDEHRQQRRGRRGRRGAPRRRAARASAAAARSRRARRAGSPRTARPGAPPCRRARRRRRRAPPARPRRRAAPCRGSRACRALRLDPPAQRDAVAVEQPVLEQHDVGALAGEQVVRVACCRRRFRPGTTPGSARSSMTSPARTAGWGSMTATRVTERTLSALLQPDLNRRRETRRLPVHERHPRGGRARRHPGRAVHRRGGDERPLRGRDPAHRGRHAARQGARLRLARVRLRVRVRAGPGLPLRRHHRDGQRAALALLRAGRELRRPRRPDEQPRAPTSSSSASRTRGVVERLVEAPLPARPGQGRAARPCAGSRPAGTRTCAAPGRDNLPDPRCRGAKPGSSRSRPIRPLPPLLPARPARLRRRAARGDGRRRAARRRPLAGCPPGEAGSTTSAGLGSNGYAIGADGARDANALLLSNTHFPSSIDTRWYELHLTIPGKLERDRRRAAGRPGRATSASTATSPGRTPSPPRGASPPTSSSSRPGDPTSYVVDGKTVADARAHGARRARRSHTFYETRWGPVVVRPDATLTWTAETAYALADPNADDLRLTQPVGGLEPQPVGRRLAPQGRADPGQPVGQLDRRRRQGQRLLRRRRRRSRTSSRRSSSDCGVAKSPLLLSAAGIGVLDGSRKRLPAAARPRRGRARDPRPGSLPQTVRRDYTFNSNDSFWLPNARSSG